MALVKKPVSLKVEGIILHTIYNILAQVKVQVLTRVTKYFPAFTNKRQITSTN